MLKPKFKYIPPDLKKIKQWVMWKAEAREGLNNKAKIPYDASTHKRASVTKRETWCDFETAERTYNNGNYDGVGFVLTDDDEYIGIDLDDCFEGDKLTSNASDFFNTLNSYTERSPSGNGLRTFIKGDFQEGSLKRDKCEAYSRDRFLTITGHHWRVTRRNPKEIKNRQNEFNKLYVKYLTSDSPNNVDILFDYELVELNRKNVLREGESHFGGSFNGHKFLTLFSKGDWESLKYPSQSEADLGLCYLLSDIYQGNPDDRRFKNIREFHSG